MIPALLAPHRRAAVFQLGALALIEAAAMTGVGIALKTAAEAATDGAVDWAPVLFLVALGGLVAAAGWERMVATADLGVRYANEVRANLARHAVALGPRNEKRRLGTMAVRMTGDLNALRDWTATGVSELVAAIGACLAAAAILCSAVGVPGLAIVCGALLLNGLTMFLLFGPLSRAEHALRRARGRVSSLAGDIVTGAAAIDAFQGLTREQRRLAKRTRRLHAATVRSRHIAGFIAAPAAAMTAMIAAAAILFLGPAMAEMQSPGGWATFLFGLGFLATGLAGGARALDLYAAFRVARKRFQRLSADISTTAEGEAQQTHGELAPTDMGLVLSGQDRVFAPRTVAVIDGGGDPAAAYAQVLALAGPGGGVLLDGQPLSPSDVALVSPTVPLLRASVKRNLTLGRVGAASPDIVEALELAGLDPKEWPAGLLLDPSLEMRDPWTAARLRLARAIAHRPAVIFIAEPVFMIGPTRRCDFSRIAVATGAVLVVAGAG
ncbi:MAG TPA: hypothetical protein DCL54_12170 [Alphaproteobacteria bacterium]|nr:hypothetical protein [Alphaproteobacteria bacterium]HAJ47324.1 hypothetical protein [Alphaproteobacteria bacterium]